MNKQEIGTLAALIRNGGIARAVGSDLVALASGAAIPIDRDATFLLTSGAGFTLAAPGADNVGRRIVIVAGTNFAYVITTVAALANGTAPKNTWTSAAFIGSSLTLRATSSTLWSVESFNLGAFA